MNVHGKAAHDQCQSKSACNGPGCRVRTGQTARKKNWARPKPNQHEAFRDTSPSKGKK